MELILVHPDNMVSKVLTISNDKAEQSESGRPESEFGDVIDTCNVCYCLYL